MPLTLSYDLTDLDGNQRTYIRSALERFHWRKVGGTVFRYDGIDDGHGGRMEDWLNHVVPSLMLFRSYIAKNKITLKTFTLDSHGTTFLDHSDTGLRYGHGIQDGFALNLAVPSNVQSSEQAVRVFVTSCTSGAP